MNSTPKRAPASQPLGTALAVFALLAWSACDSRRDANRQGDVSSQEAAESAAPYQAEVEEGLGAAVAILVDTSGSMNERAPGESRPKHVVAREALEAMLEATDGFVSQRPEFPIKIGVYSFSSGVSTVMPLQPYDRTAVRGQHGGNL